MHRADTSVDPVLAALQHLHRTVASEPLPQSFLTILDEIDASIAAANGSTAE